MVKLLVLTVIAVTITLQQCEAALKCHYCLTPCEVSKATEVTCGKTIGQDHEAVCTTQLVKGSKDPNIAIRKCEIVTKGQQPTCPTDSECKTCKTDMCNSAPVTSRAAIMGVVAACLVAKFLY